VTKCSGLFGAFVSCEENEVLWIQYLNIATGIASLKAGLHNGYYHSN
jgi:hypothetical protein